MGCMCMFFVVLKSAFSTVHIVLPQVELPFWPFFCWPLMNLSNASDCLPHDLHIAGLSVRCAQSRASAQARAQCSSCARFVTRASFMKSIHPSTKESSNN